MSKVNDEEPKVSKFQQIWSKDKDQVEKEQLELAEQQLQSGAESYLVEAKKKLLAAQKAVNTAIMEAKKDPNFGRIVEAELELLEAKVLLDKARENYKEYFGEEPKIST